ncbi:MAG: DNA polymerase III subunit alpha, partial [Chloroflexi bacterium]|nr:DNA polymerase III subunit alpha [Chloroflexota bacterium]
GEVVDLIVEFASYGFNKSHSAAYAFVAYQTAYLKAHYPSEFMASLLTSVKGNKDKVAQYVNECRNLGIEVLPPDVNESYSDFTVVGDSIRFGLSAVRNVGEGAIERIIVEREKGGSFSSIYEFSRRVDMTLLNKRAMESLIKGGAFDSFGTTRRSLALVFESAVDLGARKQKDDAAGVMSLFGDAEEATDEADPEMVDVPEWEKMELLAYEKEMLGLYVTDHPLLGIEETLKKKTSRSTADLAEEKDGANVTLGGIISKVTRVTTKKGDPMARIELEDLDGVIEAIIFPKVYEEIKSLVEVDKLVCLKGRLDKKEDETKLIALEMVALEEAQTVGRVPKLYLTIPADRFDQRLMNELKAVFKAHPGESPVIMKLKDGDRLVTLSLGANFMVDAGNGAIGELRGMLGEGVDLVEK